MCVVVRVLICVEKNRQTVEKNATDIPLTIGDLNFFQYPLSSTHYFMVYNCF